MIVEDFVNSFIKDYQLIEESIALPLAYTRDTNGFDRKRFQVRSERLISYSKMNFGTKRNYCLYLCHKFLNNFRENVEKWNRDDGSDRFEYIDEELFPAPIQESPDIHDLLASLYSRVENLENSFDIRVEETILKVLKKLSKD